MTALYVPLAGDYPNAAQLATLSPISVVKSADQTVTNNTTLVNDNALTLTLSANATYDFQLRLIYNSAATPGFKFHFTFPAGGTASYTVHCLSGGTWKDFQNNDASTPSADGTGADLNIVVSGEIFIAGTGGSATLQWAQAVANASNTIVRANSSFKARQIA